MNETKLPKKTHSFWYETGYRNHYPTLQQHLETEVAVIGGGIAGILSAYSLAKEGKEVALFEGRDLLSGTTGYTTAKLSAQHQLIYDELISRYDEKHAKLFYEANMEGIAYIREIAEENQIEAQIEEQDAFVYTQDHNKGQAFTKEADAYKKLGIDGALHQDLPMNMETEAALQMKNQAQIQPVSFLHHVLDVLKKAGVDIFEQTLIVATNQDKKSGNIKLETDNGHTITCSNAVFATHYPLFDPEKFYTKMNPEISYALALQATKEHPPGMYINDDLPKRTFRTMQAKGKHYLLVGGQSHPIGDDRSEWERYEELYQFAKETFGETEVVYRWSSHDLMTKDRVPLIGQLHPDYPGIYALTGFSKWGLANAAIGAKIIADVMAGRANRYTAIYDPHRDIPDLEESGRDAHEDEDPISTLHLSKRSSDLQAHEATIMEKDDKKIGVYKDSNGQLHQLDISCTHLGCDLNWNNGDRTWDCPCHGSRFSATGEVIQGPAIEPLQKKEA